ncbi:hypothetical protein [Hymenobacter elongatus]|uniref:Lipocalin-like domain-containing protein n=1 Tax=Hymenobacter elongatus TaxID=877208 RepID=A0A4Z0PSC5_9BACT|nr:hypothetical protein [Hymenobacter elongatus]TGE20219.1 hypothetical protein E5J99_01260 [Hymenobacter elongatus]
MKTHLFFRLLLSSLLLLAGLASAAPRLTPPTNAPVAGYWNLETNLLTRDYTIIRFFNDQHELVYEERLDNLCLDLSKGTGLCRRTARQLNVALHHVLRDPNNARQTTTQLALELGQSRRVQRVYAVR